MFVYGKICVFKGTHVVTYVGCRKYNNRIPVIAYRESIDVQEAVDVEKALAIFICNSNSMYMTSFLLSI